MFFEPEPELPLRLAKISIFQKIRCAEQMGSRIARVRIHQRGGARSGIVSTSRQILFGNENILLRRISGIACCDESEGQARRREADNGNAKGGASEGWLRL